MATWEAAAGNDEGMVLPEAPTTSVATEVTLTIKLLNNNSHQVSVSPTIGVRDLKTRVKVSRVGGVR